MRIIYIISISTLFLFSCASMPPQIKSVGYINTTPGWSVEDGCGYESCTETVGFLTWKDVSIRVEPLNNRPNGHYYDFAERLYVSVHFVSPVTMAAKFNPSLSYLILSNGEKVQSKGKISTSISDTRYDRTDFSKPVKFGFDILKDDKSHFDPFILIFDHLPPKPEETFSMKINGFYVDEVEIDIPTVHFKPSFGS